MRILFSIFAASLAAVAAAGPSVGPERKLIACGWEFYPRSPAEILAHADQFDATGLNGVQIILSRKTPQGRLLSAKTLPTDPAWPEDLFDPDIDALKKMSEHRGLKDSFFLLLRTPDRRVPWTDDAAWARIARNMRILARTARAGNMRGFLLDTEDYPQQRQFRVTAADPAYDKLAPLVRARARELFRGVFEEQPDAVVLSFWFLTHSLGAAAGQDPEGVLRATGDVWPAFVNGILDVLPPTAKLVDGCEWAYNYEALRDEFVKSSMWQRENALSLVAPENRLKYRGQMLAGSGHYMDRYIGRKPGEYWYVKPTKGSTLRSFERNLLQATESSGGYVWFWCERNCWVKWDKKLPMFPNVRRKTWEEAMPGLSKTLEAITFPQEFARERVRELKASGKLVNLVPPDAMKPEKMPSGRGFNPGVLPAAFKSWEDSSPWLHASKGVFGVDTSVGDGDSLSLSTRGVGAGGFKYTVSGVSGGEIYLVKISAKGENPSAYVEGWNMSRWYRGLPGYGIPLKPAKSGWLKGSVIVRIPDHTIAFNVYLNSANTRAGRNWFDNLEIYRIWGAPYPDVSAAGKD